MPDELVTVATFESSPEAHAAVIGTVVCPMFLVLNIYSAWLLIRVAADGRALNPAAMWKCRLAWGVNVLASMLFYLVHRIMGTSP